MQDIERKWLLTLIKEEWLKDVVPERPKKNKVKVRTPKSKIENILYNFYEVIKNAHSPDALDTFWQDNKLGEYRKIGLFANFLVELGKKLNMKIEYPKEEKEFREIFFRICERVLEEPEPTKRIIRDMINEKYRDLVSDEPEFDEEEYIAKYKEYVENELSKIEQTLDTNKEMFKEQLEKIRRVKRTNIEEIARKLNEVIFIGTDIWEMILYSILSVYAPEIPINAPRDEDETFSLNTRNAIHLLLMGDISSAKSKILKLVSLISPKATKINKFTEATFEGVATKEEIEEGVIDIANNGDLIIPEFDKIAREFTILREVMDCDWIEIGKRGKFKKLKINISIKAGGNPKNDFFLNQINLREQIPFSEGLLSRFDILIPLINTKEKNEYLLSKINIFGYSPTKVNLKRINELLTTLSQGMKQIKRVVLTEGQKQRLKEVWLRNNKELENRPLLLLRDLETLCRFVNVIAVSNFHKRKVKDGILYAKDEDIEKAISLWETLIDLRKHLYTSMSRMITTVKDKILIAIMELSKEKGYTTTEELLKYVVEEKKLCSRATLYRKIDDLLLERKIMRDGERNMKIIPVI